ncbi:MAG: hypothetical protein H6505_02270 [Calditrichaeota bacterium]|nr:hypothetical protein [Calditrichota bacterium]
MEYWWLLLVLPLIGLWNAVREAWPQLLKARSDRERKLITERAFATALLHFIAVLGSWVIPWPYKLICFLPVVAPGLVESLAVALVMSFEVINRK